MKVSLRATYGIMAAVDLAMHLETAPVQSKSIARRQAIPARFLEQVLHGMKKAGLVSSVRGAQGGYVLLKKPSEVSVVEILEALDGPLLLPSGGAKSVGAYSTTVQSLRTVAHFRWPLVCPLPERVTPQRSRCQVLSGL